MSDFPSLLVYLVLFFLTTILVYIGEKTQHRSVSIAGLLVLVLLAGLRLNVGIDYENYIRIINELKSISLPQYIESYMPIFEPTLFLASKISVAISGGPVLFFLLYSALTIFPFYYAIKRINPKYLWLAVLLFAFLFFAPSLNAVRQYAAISIAFFAIIDFFFPLKGRIQSSKTKLIFLILIAALFHSSAIATLIIIPVYYLTQKISHKNTLQVTIIYAVLVAVILFLADLIIKNIYYIPVLSKYAYALAITDGPTPNIIAKIFPVIVTTIFFRRITASDKRNILFLAMPYVTFATAMFGFIVAFGYRLSDYFNIFQIPLILSIIDLTPSSSRQRIYAVLAIFYGLIYFLYSAFLNDSHGIFPLQFMFS